MASIPVGSNAPVESIDTRSKHAQLKDGIALCLSGGGFRAMLFHASYKTMDEILKKTSADNDRSPVGWRFMEKTIQLPLTIPPPTPTNPTNYLQALLKGAGEVPEAVETIPEQAVAGVEAGIDQAKDIL